MEQLTIPAKIRSLVEKAICNQLEAFIERVSRGDLVGFEEQLYDIIKELYNLVAQGCRTNKSHQQCLFEPV